MFIFEYRNIFKYKNIKIGMENMANKKIYPDYLLRGYETAKEFVQKKLESKGLESKGLLLLFGDEEKIRSITSTMDGQLAKKFHKTSILYTDSIFQLYEEMAKQDGAIAFDKKGNLIDTGVYIENVTTKNIPKLTLEKIKNYKKSEGTRHISAAYVSLYDIDSIAVSDEIGTVMTFSNGYIIDDLVYIPNKEIIEIKINSIRKNCQEIREQLAKNGI
jgi:hypothetical protein